MDPDDIPFVLYTEQELRPLDGIFGHPSVRVLKMFLCRTVGPSTNAETAKILRNIGEDCTMCKEVSPGPWRSMLTMSPHELIFNHLVQLDTMYIRGWPFIHKVSKTTHFRQALFRRRQSTKEIWKMVHQICCLIYVGIPDYLVLDNGSGYASKKMKAPAEVFGLHLDGKPVETTSAIETIGRYPAPLRLDYEHIRADTDCQTRDWEYIRLAVFAEICTVGPNCL